MTESEFYQSVDKHFSSKATLGTNPSIILWKHRTLKDTFAYTSVDSGASNHQIMFVKSTEGELNKSSNFAVRHNCESVNQLNNILESLLLTDSKYGGAYNFKNTHSNVFHDIRKHETRNSRKYSAPRGRKAVVWYENKVLLTIIGIVILAVATNPNVTDHREAVKELALSNANSEAIRSLTKTTSANNKWESAGAAIGYSLGSGIVDNMLSSIVRRRNFLIFSLTEIRVDEDSKIVGIGVLGNIWFLNDNFE